jgi:hypothetical protein
VGNLTYATLAAVMGSSDGGCSPRRDASMLLVT